MKKFSLVMLQGMTQSDLVTGNNHVCCHVIYSGLGGHSAVLIELLGAGFLDSFTHKVLLAGVEEPRKDVTDALSKLGVEWSSIKKIPGRGSISFTQKVAHYFGLCAPSIIFLHGPAAVLAALFFKFSLSLRQRKLVIILRDTEPLQFKRNKEWFLLGLAYLFFDHVVHLSNEAAEGVFKKIGIIVDRSKTRIIPNPVSISAFKRNETTIGTNIAIGMVSRLQLKKDHITLIEAIEVLQQRLKNIFFTVKIAGSGDTSGLIQNEIRKRRLENNIFLVGEIASVDLPEFLSNLHIYIHSTFGETMSNSIIQAMAAGLPVIGSNVVGVSNLLSNDRGFLFKVGDPSDLANKIEFALNSDLERERRALNGFEFVRNELDPNFICQWYEKLITNR